MDKLSGEFILNAKETDSSKTHAHGEKDLKVQHIKNKVNPHFYSAFYKNPAGITFAEQEEGEDILLLLRRHFVTNLPWIISVVILAILPVFLSFLTQNFPFPLPSTQTLMLYLAFYYLTLFGFVLINFSLWYFHIGLITSLRVIDIDLSGILYRHVSEAKHQNIEDVSYKQVGFITSVFNYGDVTVQTAGNEANIEYDRVPQPSIVADIIGDLSQQS